MNPLIHGKSTSGNRPLRSIAPVSDTSTSILQTASVSVLEEVTATLTRPANSTLYTANDAVVQDAQTQAIPLGGVATLTGYIVGARLWSNDPSYTGVRLRLWIFDSIIEQLDNVALAIPTPANIVGYLDLPAAGSAPVYAQNLTARLPFVADAAGNLYWFLQALDGFSPLSQQTFNLTLSLERG